MAGQRIIEVLTRGNSRRVALSRLLGDNAISPRTRVMSYERNGDITLTIEQFMDGFHCGQCDKGFVSEEILKEKRG